MYGHGNLTQVKVRYDGTFDTPDPYRAMPPGRCRASDFTAEVGGVLDVVNRWCAGASQFILLCAGAGAISFGVCFVGDEYDFACRFIGFHQISRGLPADKHEVLA